MKRTINIPEEDLSAFEKLTIAEESVFLELKQQMNNLTTNSTPTDLKNILAEKKDFSDIISGLLYAYLSFGKNEDEFLELLYHVYLEKTSSTVKVETKVFNQKYKHLISADNPLLSAISKRFAKSHYEKVILDKKIITDIRPLFKNDTEGLYGTIISNQLRFIYDEDSSTKEIYFYIDDEDLRELKLLIEETLRKNEVLEKHLAETKNLNLIK